MSRKQPTISEEQARELWQRALELQNAAERSKPDPHALITSDQNDLSLDQVATAAEGAGIDPDYVRMALAERQLPDADRIDPQLWTARWVKRILREADAIEETRFIAASPAQVVAALKTVSIRPEFELIHEAVIGDDPARDGVLVYRLPIKNDTSFHQNLNFTDARVLLFAIRPDGEGTRVRLRMPLFRRGINLALLGGASGLAGLGGMSAGTAVVGSLAGVIGATAVVAMVPIVAGAAGAVLGVGAFRSLYRWGVGSGRSSALRLLQAVEAEAESRPAIGSAK
jgi:hypothetical protein